MFLEFLKKQYEGKASQEAMEWLVMCLFSSIFHFATMCASSTFKDIKKGKKDDNEIEESLVTMATALTNHMLSQV